MSKKEYENAVMRNDKFTEDTMISLGLVKKYIVAHKLIIVGGMAIDLAMRLKGDALYDDDVLPDYDFYSPTHHKDAYKIAEQLKIAGMENITVINANHTSTMRVRVNYVVVADVTYMPKKIFDNLPTLRYRDMIIIHPHYQLIDQHRALSLPYENPPWEVITHRWKKDAKRHDMLYNYYPLEEIKGGIELRPEIVVPNLLLHDQCISGFVGLLYWAHVAKKYGFKHKVSIGSIKVETSGMLVVMPVDAHGVTLYSNDIKTLVERISSKDTKEQRNYKRFLDKLPYKSILDNNWEVFDNKGFMLSAEEIEKNIYVANLQNIMLYMLTNIILLRKIKDANRGDSFYAGYHLARSIVSWAGRQYKSTKNNKFLKFLPSVQVYGTSEVSDSYINSKRQFLEKLGEIPKRNLQPNMIYPETFEKNKIPKENYDFKAEESILFQFDGAPTSKYTDRIYI